MNSPIAKIQVGDHIDATVAQVFATMLSLTVTRTSRGPLPPARISGAIGIAGEQITGTVYLHFPEALAHVVTRAMLQLPELEALAESDVNDVMGELSNMVGCRLKSVLNDADIFCAVSTPSVIRGAFAVEAPQDVSAERFYFICQDQRFEVEVHLQLEPAVPSTI